ncbi:hypothetical protein E2P84_44975 [Burkholderia cepacia]|uniref:Uncharacterized protein n=1 Tax=Burkholderia cepacia TaxID=292 RepID=A0AAX2RR50_BURCE|nr:hypothetical protein [Burkholderia cepacia]TES59054.1 hypothetical protein E2P84_44975 [Burkholderia cepacia]TET01724.1 hypothetical protein E3D36_16960 [Burkholderia cepacia]TEU47582.1 hypothetical protein E3D37_16390 [Burkholderia cepacia]TEU53454.1 hypothetical protein E3D38_11975 [Burkholderia cepacia]TEV02060.1 hypothetical protein E3D40_12905 [Burkholderia cepacia]
MNRKLTAVVLVLAGVVVDVWWLYLRTPQVGSVCLSIQGAKATADGSPVVCVSGAWKQQN